MPHKYNDVILTITDQVGTIKLNRPSTLNAFGGTLLIDFVAALRELNEHPQTVFTVITGEGRFFSAGADVRGRPVDGAAGPGDSKVEKKLAAMTRLTVAVELLRSLIDHTKVVVLALNGPAVGGGAAWFPGVADIVLAATSTYLQVPFSALGLVPEFGSAVNFAQTIGIHRANDFLMLGRKITAVEMEQWGISSQTFPVENFHEHVRDFLEEKLRVNDGKSMMEAKRLMNASLRDGRLVAVVNAWEALAERIVEGAPDKRFAIKRAEMEQKSKTKSQL